MQQKKKTDILDKLNIFCAGAGCTLEEISEALPCTPSEPTHAEPTKLLTKAQFLQRIPISLPVVSGILRTFMIDYKPVHQA